MSKIAMNNDHRLGRRAEAKLHLKQSRFNGVPKLESAGKHKPGQPTVIKAHTAERFDYLFQRGLASFARCKLVVAVRRAIKFGIMRDLRGVPSYASA